MRYGQRTGVTAPNGRRLLKRAFYSAEVVVAISKMRLCHGGESQHSSLILFPVGAHTQETCVRWQRQSHAIEREFPDQPQQAFQPQPMRLPCPARCDPAATLWPRALAVPAPETHL